MKKILLLLLIFLIQLSAYPLNGYKRIKLSDKLELIKISDKAYVHVSYSEAPNYGRFSSNGLILISEGKAFLFDTPVEESVTKLLVSWITDVMKLKLEGFIPNHWHNDCMGGLQYLKNKGIESFANQMTIDIAKSKNLPVPALAFKHSLILQLGKQEIDCYYLGAAHSSDNIVVWIPKEKILFAGCMVKDMKSNGLGNTADANLKEWPITIDKVMGQFSAAKIVIPGHGDIGGLELLQHTKDLLK